MRVSRGHPVTPPAIKVENIGKTVEFTTPYGMPGTPLLKERLIWWEGGRQRTQEEWINYADGFELKCLVVDGTLIERQSRFVGVR
jgi:hypothetical protein